MLRVLNSIQAFLRNIRNGLFKLHAREEEETMKISRNNNNVPIISRETSSPPHPFEISPLLLITRLTPTHTRELVHSPINDDSNRNSSQQSRRFHHYTPFPNQLSSSTRGSTRVHDPISTPSKITSELERFQRRDRWGRGRDDTRTQPSKSYNPIGAIG